MMQPFFYRVLLCSLQAHCQELAAQESMATRPVSAERWENEYENDKERYHER